MYVHCSRQLYHASQLTELNPLSLLYKINVDEELAEVMQNGLFPPVQTKEQILSVSGTTGVTGLHVLSTVWDRISENMYVTVSA